MAPKKVRLILVKAKLSGHGTQQWLPGVKGGRGFHCGGGAA